MKKAQTPKSKRQPEPEFFVNCTPRKNRETAIPNEVLFDPKLSSAAKGLFCIVVANEGTQLTIDELIEYMQEDLETLHILFEELLQSGHLGYPEPNN